MEFDGSKTGLRVLYYGAGWPTNIGNAFIDLGALAILRSAVPNARISFASEMPRWFFGPGIKNTRTVRFWHKQEHRVMDNALDIASVTQCDLVVFSGMAACGEFLEVNGPTLLSLARRGIPILLLGVGALAYSDEEKKDYADFLRQINPIGFICRDEPTFKMFADIIPGVYPGIDCGFFLPEAYIPLPLELSAYVVAAFDTQAEPELSLQGRQLLRAHHDCWGPPREEYTQTEKTLISDIPYDYLALYAQAEEIHTDRVHACVAGLTYGHQVRLYHPTLRGYLFDSVGCHNIRERLVQADMNLLAEKKKNQIAMVERIISDKFGKS
ncbi:MAG: polysaccharide pyruvyl transferase family protein [Phycisphaerae bacterium]